MPYKLVVFDGSNVLEERPGFSLDAAEDEADWHVRHDGATKVEIRNEEDDALFTTIGEPRRVVSDV
jgi:hypothetical protein